MRPTPLHGLFALLLCLLIGCQGGAGDDDTATATLQLTHLSSTDMPVGTHRPEIRITDSGQRVLAVVEPQGTPGEVGFIKHQAYLLDDELEAIGDPFPIASIDALYGEPADHRMLLRGDELLVVYQALNYGEAAPMGDGPSEQYATDQSLLLARFDLDGNELLRAPIVAQSTDFAEDNFPDHCMLWKDGELFVSTGTMSPIGRIRQVDPDTAAVEASYTFDTLDGGISGTIGNSLLSRDGTLSMFSSTSPGGSAALTLSDLDEGFTDTRVADFEDADRERHFPTDSTALGSYTLVAHISRDRGGAQGLESNPYSARLLVLDADLEAVKGRLAELGQWAHAIEGSDWEKRLRSAGFAGSKAADHKIVIVHSLDEGHPLSALAGDPASWFFTDGDRDDELVH